MKQRFGMIATIGLMLAIWSVHTIDVKAADSSDIASLWNLSSTMLGNNDVRKVKIVHSGLYQKMNSHVDFRQTALRLSELLHMPQGEFATKDGHQIYKVHTLNDSGSVKLMLMEVDGSTSYLIVERESLESSVVQAEQWQESMGEYFRAGGIVPQWHVQVQGIAHFDVHSEEVYDRLQTSLDIQLNPKMIEQYRDERMLSTTYYTPKLKLFELSGNKKVNVQTAFRQMTESSDWKITIGSPLILAE